jgi:hypothetical protein
MSIPPPVPSERLSERLREQRARLQALREAGDDLNPCR